MLAEGVPIDATTAFVFCGGGIATAPLPPTDGALSIAADGGVAEALRRGLRVDVLVGDLDSADPGDVEVVERAGGRVVRHPVDKDASDLELAIEAAAAEGVGRVVVVGGRLGRLDHLLGNALLLTAPRFASLELDAVFGPDRLHVVRGRRELDGVPGDLVSLFAVHGPARGVRTEGLRWNLDREVLLPGSSRGVSNRFLAPRALVTVERGVLVAVRPGEEDDG